MGEVRVSERLKKLQNLTDNNMDDIMGWVKSFARQAVVYMEA